MKVHIRSKGRSRSAEVPRHLEQNGSATPHELFNYLVARGLVSDDQRQQLVIDRHPDGYVVRPPAVWG